MRPIKIGLLGIGIVGSGKYKVLTRNQKEICGRAGRTIEVAMVAARNIERARKLVSVIMLTHETQEKNIMTAMAKIEALAAVTGQVTRIRVEQLS